MLAVGAESPGPGGAAATSVRRLVCGAFICLRLASQTLSWRTPGADMQLALLPGAETRQGPSSLLRTASGQEGLRRSRKMTVTHDFCTLVTEQ